MYMMSFRMPCHVTNLIINFLHHFRLGTRNHSNNPLRTNTWYALCKTRTQLGPSSSLDSSSSKQQQHAAAGGPKVLGTTPWLKTGIQVAQNDRGAKAHHRN